MKGGSIYNHWLKNVTPHLTLLLSCSQVTYSKNHNFLRTVGFFATLAAEAWLECFFTHCVSQANSSKNKSESCKNVLRWGIAKGVLCSFLHPHAVRGSSCHSTIIKYSAEIVWCSLVEFHHGPNELIFLFIFDHPSRSSPSTGRTWINPKGGNTKCVVLANIFCMRMLYMYPGLWLYNVSRFDRKSLIWNMMLLYSCFELRLWYAWQRGVYIMIEQPISSVAWPPFYM